jgi:hypothetical protein
MEFDASRSANIWKWQQNGGTSLQEQMSLDNNNALVLYNQASSPVAQITLNPLGTSTFANSLTLNGANNLMPNQFLTGSGSVITESLGDSRYVLGSSVVVGSATTGGSGPTIGLNGGTATGPSASGLTHSLEVAAATGNGSGRIRGRRWRRW